MSTATASQADIDVRCSWAHTVEEMSTSTKSQTKSLKNYSVSLQTLFPSSKTKKEKQRVFFVLMLHKMLTN